MLRFRGLAWRRGCVWGGGVKTPKSGGLGGRESPGNFSHFHFHLLVKNINFRQRPARCSCQLITLKVLYNDNECLKLNETAGCHVQHSPSHIPTLKSALQLSHEAYHNDLYQTTLFTASTVGVSGLPLKICNRCLWSSFRKRQEISNFAITLKGVGFAPYSLPGICPLWNTMIASIGQSNIQERPDLSARPCSTSKKGELLVKSSKHIIHTLMLNYCCNFID